MSGGMGVFDYTKANRAQSTTFAFCVTNTRQDTEYTRQDANKINNNIRASNWGNTPPSSGHKVTH